MNPTQEVNAYGQLDFLGTEPTPLVGIVPPHSTGARDHSPPLLRPANTARPRGKQLRLPLPAVPLKALNSESFPEPIVHALREGMLEGALHLLIDGRASKKTRRDILDWIAVPIRPWSQAWAFSFQICCLEYGWDAETRREEILKRFAKESAIESTGAPRSANPASRPPWQSAALAMAS